MGPAKNLPYILQEPISLDLTNGLQRNQYCHVLCLHRRFGAYERTCFIISSTNGTTAIHETTSGASLTRRRPGRGRPMRNPGTHSLPPWRCWQRMAATCSSPHVWQRGCGIYSFGSLNFACHTTGLSVATPPHMDGPFPARLSASIQ